MGRAARIPLPKNEWPLCQNPGCKKPIPPGNYCNKDHKKRKTCGAEACLKYIYALNGQRNKSGKSKTTVKKERAETTINVRPKMSPQLAAKLDREQARLNIEVAVKLAKKCGYHHGEVKVYTPEEIAKIQVTPIHLIRNKKVPPLEKAVLSIFR